MNLSECYAENLSMHQNIASLIVNKFHNGTMNYKINIITKREKNVLMDEKNNLLQENQALKKQKMHKIQILLAIHQTVLIRH